MRQRPGSRNEGAEGAEKANRRARRGAGQRGEASTHRTAWSADRLSHRCLHHEVHEGHEAAFVSTKACTLTIHVRKERRSEVLLALNPVRPARAAFDGAASNVSRGAQRLEG